MTTQKTLIGAFVLASGFMIPLLAQPTATQPVPQSSDPNWIGPQSWHRHFTIPAFVMTSRGMTQKVATSQPASYGSKEPASYWASRQRRTNTEGSSSTSSSSSGETKSRSSRSSRSEEGGYSSKSSRSSRSSSSEGHSSRSSSRSSRESSHSSRSNSSGRSSHRSSRDNG